ncbi:MAG: GNAT family N-acetyltransferase [Alphaproteobacteria bacterium]|nr:GNAT family N-acetyltransferase [Alphaproteobacteria bacterium]
MRSERHILHGGEVLEIAVPQPGEAVEIVAFLNRAGGESSFLAFGAGGYVYTVEEQKTLIEDCRERGDGYMLNARIGEMLVANLYLFPLTHDFKSAEFGLCVAKSHWGRGIGTRMLAHVLAWASHRGLEEICIQVHPKNVAAQRLYARHGFAPAEEGDAESAMAMRLPTASRESLAGQA